MDQLRVAEALERYLPAPAQDDDKYARGVIGFVTGSETFPGAAVLGVGAAQAAQVGMVRYFGPDRVSDLVLASHPEVVAAANVSPNTRVSAWVVGSGVGSGDSDQIRNIEVALSQCLPTVVDAGALEILDLTAHASTPMVLTPHAAELRRLVERYLPARSDLTECTDDRVRSQAASALAEALGQTVLAKGNTTFIAGPDGLFAAIGPNSPWLATAGTGDVLAGLLGALAVRNFDNWQSIGVLAVWLHSQAAELASASGAVRASDLHESLPRVFSKARLA